MCKQTSTLLIENQLFSPSIVAGNLIGRNLSDVFKLFKSSSEIPLIADAFFFKIHPFLIQETAKSLLRVNQPSSDSKLTPLVTQLGG